MTTSCSICSSPLLARGFCKKHYRAFMKFGDPNGRLNLRGVPFHERYTVEGDCWLWIGSQNDDGYGLWTAYGEQKAHRASWVMHNGPVPEGLHVLHTCDTPPCVNPEHLYLGTHQQNMTDLREKGRAYGAKGEANYGSKITEDQALKIMTDPRRAKLIAAEYGINHATVSAIRTGRLWSHLFDESFRAQRKKAGPVRLTNEQKKAIVQDPRRQVDIAKEYGVTQGFVSAIKRTFGT